MRDLFSDDMRRNPYSVYDQMRSASPVFLPPFDIWMVFDFEGVKRALLDHNSFSSDLTYAPGHGNPGEWFIFYARSARCRSGLTLSFLSV